MKIGELKARLAGLDDDIELRRIVVFRDSQCLVEVEQLILDYVSVDLEDKKAALAFNSEKTKLGQYFLEECN